MCSACEAFEKAILKERDIIKTQPHEEWFLIDKLLKASYAIDTTHVKSLKCTRSIVSDSLRSYRLCIVVRLLRPWDFPGKTTGVSCHFVLQNKIKSIISGQFCKVGLILRLQIRKQGFTEPK